MITLEKVQGSGNSFFLLDQDLLPSALNENELSRLALALCPRKTGLTGGADGILAVTASPTPSMHVINADGSQASMCGNGLRTVARYLHDHYGFGQEGKRDTVDGSFHVSTLNANLQVRSVGNFAPGLPAYSVEILPVSFDSRSLPFTNLGRNRLINCSVPELLPDLRFTALSVPNPHVVSFMTQDQGQSDLLSSLGNRLNSPNPYFPNGVNVNFAHILGRNTLYVRTFERGVGLTNACGTGMSAASLCLVLTHPQMGEANQEITVYNPGGMVKTRVHYQEEEGTYTINLIGNATVTHLIELDESCLYHPPAQGSDLEKKEAKIKETPENTAYQDFVAKLPYR